MQNKYLGQLFQKGKLKIIPKKFNRLKVIIEILPDIQCLDNKQILQVFPFCDFINSFRGELAFKWFLSIYLSRSNESHIEKFELRF